jgi:hypothetical protein
MNRGADVGGLTIPEVMLIPDTRVALGVGLAAGFCTRTPDCEPCTADLKHFSVVFDSRWLQERHTGLLPIARIEGVALTQLK